MGAVHDPPPLPGAFIDHFVSKGLSDADIDDKWHKLHMDGIYDKSSREALQGWIKRDAHLKRPTVEDVEKAQKGTLFEGMNIEKAFAPQLKEAAEKRAAMGQFKKGQSRNDSANYAVLGTPFLDHKANANSAQPPPEQQAPAPIRKAAETRVPPKSIHKESKLQMSSMATPGPPTKTFSTAEHPNWYKIQQEVERALQGSYSMRDYPKAGAR